jgi:RNA polymerase-binding transcription factor DksA
MSSEQREAMEMAEDREDELLRRIKKLLSLVGSQGKCKGCGAEIWWVP